MKMELNHNGQTIILDKNEQSLVYEFYRLHCTMERIIDIFAERNDEKQFESEKALKTIAERVLSLMDDNHISEDDAIDIVLDDDDYINAYFT